MNIDKEFQRSIPTLLPEELAQLEENIKANGCRDPLVVWKEKDTLLDGHNRLEICTRLGIKYKVVAISLPDREAAADWIDANQLGRRNLTPDQASILRGRRFNRREIKQGSRTDLTSAYFEPKLETAKSLAEEYHISPATIKRDGQLAEHLNQHPGEMQAVMNREKSLADVRREIKRTAIKEKLEDIAAIEAKTISGVFDVIVIDPPWPMEKIERDERPNQSEFDYPVMTLEEIETLQLPTADDCHVWLWTTQKFLPSAFDILKTWRLNYICTFVWHKPGGFQPYNLPQYNCEFALYARKGSPVFLDTKALPTCFNAPRGAHSEKPEEFYELLRRVTCGRRLDMFNRRSIEGFEEWGNQA